MTKNDNKNKQGSFKYKEMGGIYYLNNKEENFKCRNVQKK